MCNFFTVHPGEIRYHHTFLYSSGRWAGNHWQLANPAPIT